MRNEKSKIVALTGMLFALSITLSYLEFIVTPLLGLMPAMKLGLSNIVVMYALLFLNKSTALTLVLLKAGFALLTRGVTAGALSLSGGLLSFCLFCVLLSLPQKPSGYIFSVSGALAHNIGQLIAAAMILSSRMALTYMPILLVVGLLVGSLTYAVSCPLFAALGKIHGLGKPKINFRT